MTQLFFTLKKSNKWVLIHTSKSGAKYIITDKGKKRYITHLLKKQKGHKKCKQHSHKGGWYSSNTYKLTHKGGWMSCFQTGGWGSSLMYKKHKGGWGSSYNIEQQGGWKSFI